MTRSVRRWPMQTALAGLSFAVLGGLHLAPATAQWADSTITGQVPRGKTTGLKRYVFYDSRGCRGMPPPVWTVDPKPKLGTVVEFKGSMKLPNGPCPSAEMPYLEIRYTAGSVAGEDRFRLYVNDGVSFTPIPVIVNVR